MLVKIGAVFGLATVMLVMLLGQTRVFFSMSRDGLLPKWASAVHPKFRTPWITTIVFGAFAAIMPAFFPIEDLSELVNIGTLLAFTIVSRRSLGVARAPSRNGTAVQDSARAAGADSRDDFCALSHDAPGDDYVGSDDRLAADWALSFTSAIRSSTARCRSLTAVAEGD